jgi:hypothetical protein
MKNLPRIIRDENPLIFADFLHSSFFIFHFLPFLTLPANPINLEKREMINLGN